MKSPPKREMRVTESAHLTMPEGENSKASTRLRVGKLKFQRWIFQIVGSSLGKLFWLIEQWRSRIQDEISNLEADLS
jgi:hypothetical protein